MYEPYVVRADWAGVLISGGMHQPVRLNMERYFRKFCGLPSSLARELVAVAAGIYAVDRISKRRFGRPQHGVRTLRLTFQVQNVGFWSSKEVRDSLLDIILFLTGDDWQVDVEELADLGAAPRNQDYLNLSKPSVERIALYSGGLDSAAGLAHQILVKGVRNYLLITVGHQSGIYRRVTQQLEAIERISNNCGNEPLCISHSTLTTSLKRGKGTRMRDQENSQRSRALLFCATAVAAADVFGLNTVDMFENGVGSINLPVMTGMFGRGLATRGAHPTFLAKMSMLASLVLQRQLTFALPFRDFTKGEVIRSVAPFPGVSEWLQQSSSCIHTSLRKAGVTHCGECPACIERRQAFLSGNSAVNLEDYLLDVVATVPSKLVNKEYFYLYRLDAMKWSEGKPEVLRRLNRHLAITGVPSATHQQIAELQRRHSHEVIHAFGLPFQSL